MLAWNDENEVTESVLESTVDDFEVSHSTCSGGLSSFCFFAPVIYREFGSRIIRDKEESKDDDLTGGTGRERGRSRLAEGEIYDGKGYLHFLILAAG